MKFEPQCKTRADLYREWARVLDMCDGTGVEPEYIWGVCHQKNPVLDEEIEHYEFPIAIVEGKLVWRGDELYKPDGEKFIAVCEDTDSRLIIRCKLGSEPALRRLTCEYLSWNPPRKTITINGKKLPAPDESGMNRLIIDGRFNNKFYFKNVEDCERVEAAIIEALESRPPKM